MAGEGYSFPVDMWAMGIILYMLLHDGQHPWIKTLSWCNRSDSGQMDLMKLVDGKTPNAEKVSGPKAYELVRRFDRTISSSDRKNKLDGTDLAREMLRKDPDTRITATAALLNVWLAKSV